jgi:alkylhydroperoxidase family enzyme
VPAALIEAMERHQTSSLFSERDRAALALVEAVVCYSERSRTAAEAVLAGARRYFTDAEVTSILRIATEEHFYNPATGALGRDAGSMMLSSESRSGGWTESEPPAQGTSR